MSGTLPVAIARTVDERRIAALGRQVLHAAMNPQCRHALQNVFSPAPYATLVRRMQTEFTQVVLAAPCQHWQRRGTNIP